MNWLDITMTFLVVYIIIMYILTSIINRRIKRRYNPDDDLSRKGHERNGGLLQERESKALAAVGIQTGTETTRGQGSLQTANADSPKPDKQRSPISNFLSKFRRKRRS